MTLMLGRAVTFGAGVLNDVAGEQYVAMGNQLAC